MIAVATLQTDLTLNSTAFRTGMVQAAATANSTLKGIQQQAVQTASALSAITNAAKTIGGLSLIGEGLKGLIDAQVQLQAIHYTLLSATGSSLGAANAMTFLRNEADTLGQSLPDVAEGFARLSAAATASGVAMTDQKNLFDAFAKASTTLHLSTAQSGRALLALQEMFSRGTITARQLNQQLGQAIPGSAARVRNAVMEMVKGTDLAGKSFEDLLKGGKLVTSQFFPALVTALQQAGSGWEDASQGLNANLNRLSTAWFNLKTELSSGLFSEAVSSGAAVLARNLNNVATAIELVAAVAAARTLSSVVGSGISRIAAPIQAARGGQILASTQADIGVSQAAEAAAGAKVYEAEAKSLLDVDAASLAAVRSQKLLAAETRGSAAAAFELAAANDLAARQDVARLQNAAALSSNIRFLSQAERAAAVAQEELVIAQKQYTSASEHAILFLKQERELTASLSAARAVLTEATEAAALAEANLAKAQALQAATNAFGGLTAMIERAGKSLGSFVLGLTGGPWGLAILAVGGLVVAFESAKEAAEQLTKQTDETVKSTDELVKSGEELRRTYREVGNADPLSKLKDSADQASESLVKVEKDFTDAKAAFDRMQKVNSGEGLGFGESGIADKIADAWLHVTGQYDAANDAAQRLSTARDKLVQLYGEQEAAYLTAYGVDWKDLGVVFDKLGSTSIPNLIQQFKNLSAARDSGIDQAREKVNAYVEDLQKGYDAAAKKLRQIDMTAGQRARDDLAQAQKNATAGNVPGGLSPSAIQLATGTANLLDKIDADKLAKENARKAATAAAAAAAAQAREAQNLADATANTTAALEAQLDTNEKLTPSEKKLAEEMGGHVKAFNGMTSAQKATEIAAEKYNATLEQQIIDTKRAKAEAEAWTVAQENLNRVLNNSRNELSDRLSAFGQSDQQAADQAYITSLQRQYAERKLQIDKEHKDDEFERNREEQLNKDLLATQLADYKKYVADREAVQHSALLGEQKAVADFIQSANDLYSQAQQFTSDGIQGFDSAFAQFASGAESASKAFGDYVQSMKVEAFKFLADQTMKSFLLAVSAPGTEGQAGQGQSFWTNLKGSLLGTFGGGAAGGQTAATVDNTRALMALTSALTTQGALGGASGGGLGGLFGSLLGGDGGGLGGLFGGGSSAASMGGLFDNVPIQDMFGGFMAGGGTAQSRKMYRVAEQGPELLDVGGESYLMMGNRSGKVTPNHELSTATGDLHIHHNYYGGPPSRTTRQQSDDNTYRAARRGQRDR